MTKTIQANLLLLLTAVLWGSSLVAMDAAMSSMGPFAYNAARMLLAAVVLLPCIKWQDRMTKKQNPDQDVQTWKTMTAAQKKTLLTGGFVCGLVIAAGTAFLHFGILYTSAGKAGFVASLSIVLVPLAGIFFGHKVGPSVWGAVALCVAGLFLLCVTETLTIGFGDTLLLICAVCFTVQTLVVAHIAPKTDSIRLSFLQFLVAGLIFSLLALLFEQPTLGGILAGWLPVVFGGLLGCAVGNTLQIIAQRDTAPAVAALLMSLQSVFALLVQWAIFGELLSPRELSGSLLMMAGIVLSQLPMLIALRRRKAKPIG